MRVEGGAAGVGIETEASREQRGSEEVRFHSETRGRLRSDLPPPPRTQALLPAGSTHTQRPLVTANAWRQGNAPLGLADR